MLTTPYMHGQIVRVGDPFSNGLLYPGGWWAADWGMDQLSVQACAVSSCAEGFYGSRHKDSFMRKTF